MIPLAITAAASSLIVSVITAGISRLIYKQKAQIYNKKVSDEREKLKNHALRLTSMPAKQKKQELISSVSGENGNYWYTEKDMKMVIEAGCQQDGGGRDEKRFNNLLCGDKRHEGTLPESKIDQRIKKVGSENFYDNVKKGTRYVVAVPPIITRQVIYKDSLSSEEKNNAAVQVLDARKIISLADFSAYQVYEVLRKNHDLKDKISKNITSPLIAFLDEQLRLLFSDAKGEQTEKRDTLLRVCMYYKQLIDYLKNRVLLSRRSKNNMTDKQAMVIVGLFIKIELEHMLTIIDRNKELDRRADKKHGCEKFIKVIKKKGNEKLLKTLQQYAVFICHGANSLNKVENPDVVMKNLSTLAKGYDNIVTEHEEFTLLKNALLKMNPDQVIDRIFAQMRIALLSENVFENMKKALNRYGKKYQDAIAEIVPRLLSRKNPLHQHGKILMPILKGGAVFNNTAKGHWKYLEIRFHYEAGVSNGKRKDDYVFVTINYSDPYGSSGLADDKEFKEHICQAVMNRCMEEIFYHGLQQLKVNNNDIFNNEDILRLRLYYDKIFHIGSADSANWIATARIALVGDQKNYKIISNSLLKNFGKVYPELAEAMTLKEKFEHIIAEKLKILFTIANIEIKHDSDVFKTILAFVLENIPIAYYRDEFSHYDNYAPKIQSGDASTCGVCTAEAIKARIVGKPLPIEQEAKAIHLRKQQISSVYSYLQKSLAEEELAENFSDFLSKQSVNEQKKVYDVKAYQAAMNILSEKNKSTAAVSENTQSTPLLLRPFTEGTKKEEDVKFSEQDNGQNPSDTRIECRVR